jgi:hypothetical protein
MSEKLREFLGSELLPLWADGEKLLASASGGFSDYSFVVFPFAKIYEGFLKKLFLALGAINDYQYNNDRWRVGRALNPQLEKEFRHTESVYDHLVNLCGGGELADELWRVWKKGRNQIFHFWPGRTKPLPFGEAKEIVAEIEAVMEKSLEECKIEQS